MFVTSLKKIFKNALESIFNCVYPLLRPAYVQRFLRCIGFKFPYYRFAEKLEYRGVVDFSVNGKMLYMQSYNCPFEMFIFWFGIYGYWEPLQLKVWSQLVRDADLILDIGANNGIYSLIATTNPTASIIAFEPVPAVLDMLKTNIGLNTPHQIEVKPMLVGDKVGSAVLYIPREGWVDVASIDKNFAGQVYGEGTKLREFPCDMTTVDAVLAKRQSRVTEKVLCKIDVKQAESLVLSGMSQTLNNRNVQFIVELLHPENFVKARALIPASYTVYAIDEVSKSVYAVTDFTPGATNYLFTHNKEYAFIF